MSTEFDYTTCSEDDCRRLIQEEEAAKAKRIEEDVTELEAAINNAFARALVTDSVQTLSRDYAEKWRYHQCARAASALLERASDAMKKHVLGLVMPDTSAPVLRIQFSPLPTL